MIARVWPLLLLAVSAVTLWVVGPALPVASPDRPFALAALALPGLLWAPGVGFAARIGAQDRLQRGLDAAWIGLAITWIDVALVREAGLRGGAAAWAQWGLALGWTQLGLFLSRRAAPAATMARRDRWSAGLVVVALLGFVGWKHVDLARPLDAHWFLAGADEEGHDTLPVRAGAGWTGLEALGWPEAGAWRGHAESADLTLVADAPARGRVLLVVRGPLGSQIEAGGQSAIVAAAPVEDTDEGPVARYLRRGSAAIAVDVDLAAGQALPIHVDDGAGGHAVELYGMPGTEALWSLHAVGALRHVHYYQLLNQVENQVWAEELLDSRWFTMNQPPGWSPILAVATLWVMPDLPGANMLFLYVLLLVGLSGVRLAVVLAPQMSLAATALPAAMTLSHGLLMIEPGSTNFPDSLYAASLLGAAAALLSGQTGRFAALAAASGLLRYPGLVVCALLVGAWRLSGGAWSAAALRRLALAAGLLAVGTAAGLLAGQLPDLGFVVWFEIFPEHWHDDYALSSLLPRIPEFLGLWCRYTGGAILCILPWLFGSPSPMRRGLRTITAATVAYALVLGTVDHHPSHYFLPLVGFAGAMAVAASSMDPPRPLPSFLRRLVAPAVLLGVLWFLRRGEV